MAYLPPMNGGRLNASIAGNTAGVSSLLSSGTMVLAGGNNVTLSANGSVISINAPTGGGGSINFSAGTTSANLASVTFASSNNVAFGLNAGVITASASQSAQTQSNVQAIGGGASTAATGTIVFSNSNNINFGLNGQTMTASYAGAAGGANTFGAGSSTTNNNMSGNQGYISGSSVQLAFAGGSNITLSQSINASSATITVLGPSLVNSNGFSFGSNNGSVTASYTGGAFVNFSASNASANLASVTFANANSISFGLAGGVITASAQPDGIQAVSAGTTNLTNGTLSFANSNNINFGLNGSVLTASYAGGAGGGIALANSQTTYSTGTANLSGSGGINIVSTTGQQFIVSAPATSSITATNITVVTNGSTIGFSGASMFDAGVSNLGNTAGSTGVSNTNGLVLVGGNNVTLSQSTNATGAYVTVNAGPSAARWEYPMDGFSSLGTAPNYLLSIQHMYVPFNVTGASAKIAGSMSYGTTASATTGSVTASLWMGLYTLSGSTLRSLATSSFSQAFSINNTSNTGNNSTMSGMRQLTVPLAVTMTGGEYWVAAMLATSTNYSPNSFAFNIYGNPSIATAASGAAIMPIGAGPSSARDVFLFQGVYSTTTAAMPSSIVGPDINNLSQGYVQRAAFYNAIYSATF